MCQRNCAVYKMMSFDDGAFRMPRLNVSFTGMTINNTIGKAVQRLVLPLRSLGVAVTNVSSFLVRFNGSSLGR